MARRRPLTSTRLRVLGSASLCPKCELRFFESSLPVKRSYTKQSVETSTTKLCAELRAYAKKAGVECRHFRGVGLNGFIQRRKRRRK